MDSKFRNALSHIKVKYFDKFIKTVCKDFENSILSFDDYVKYVKEYYVEIIHGDNVYYESVENELAYYISDATVDAPVSFRPIT